MTLNSLDVQNKTFNPQWRGFNKHEVDEFLDIVVRDYDDFAQTLKDQERELKSLRERVKYFDEMKDSLNKSIVVAQDAADNLRAQAEKEADGMISDAKAKSQMNLSEAATKSQMIIEAAKKEASLILNAASDDARELVRNTDDLKRKMRMYHQRMSSLIETQMASIQSDDWENVIKPASSDYLINPEEKLQEIIDTTTRLSADEVVDMTPATEEVVEQVVETHTVTVEPTFGTGQTVAESLEEVKSEAAQAVEAEQAEEEHETEIFPELDQEPVSVENVVNETLPTEDSESEEETHE